MDGTWLGVARHFDRHVVGKRDSGWADDALSHRRLLFQIGSWSRPLVSYLTAWSLFGLQRIIMWEIPFLGIKVVAARFAASFFFPPLAGWLCELIWEKLHA